MLAALHLTPPLYTTSTYCQSPVQNLIYMIVAVVDRLRLYGIKLELGGRRAQLDVGSLGQLNSFESVRLL